MTAEHAAATQIRPVEIPKLRPYVPATAGFGAGGTDSPRAFLERALAALEAWEPKIGAFVSLNLAGAREAADRSTERWRAGRPRSAIDGMPVGVKDIIETIDMPTENGSALFAGFRSGRDGASVAALREAGCVILGKTVTTEFAATEPRGTRNPWDFSRTPGGSSSGSAAAVAVGAISVGLGTQVLGSILRPASFCGCYGFKPTVGAVNRGGSYDGLSQSVHGTIAASLPEAWLVAFEIAQRAGGDPGFPGLYGPAEPPAAARPRRLAVLQTDGWAGAIHGARELSMDINAWESRWPLNTYAARDAGNPGKLSKAMHDRLAQAEAMTLDDYRARLADRARRRGVYAALAAEFDSCITLAAPGAAPAGLGSTGDPVFAAPGSMLGVPTLTLPVLADGGLPLGLQLMGFADRDAALFATAAAVLELVK